MSSNQIVGLGLLIGLGAVAVGYLVSNLVPRQHFPRTAGVLATNAVIAGFAVAGVEVAAQMLGWFVLITVAAAWQLVGADADERERSKFNQREPRLITLPAVNGRELDRGSSKTIPTATSDDTHG